jgi:hypothetical protein
MAPHSLTDPAHRFTGLVAANPYLLGYCSAFDSVSCVQDDAEEHRERARAEVDDFQFLVLEDHVRLLKHGPGEVHVGHVVAEQVEKRDFILVVIRHAIASKLVQRLLTLTNEKRELSVVQAMETAQLCDFSPRGPKHRVLQ